MKKKQESLVKTSPSGKHIVAKVENKAVVALIKGVEKKEPIQAKNEEIAKEKASAKQKQAGREVLFNTITSMEQEAGKFAFISDAVKKHFKLTEVFYTDKLRRWDFPYEIGSKFKRHTIFRKYQQVGLFVDIFDAKTSKAEINRIKAHMDALNLKYTYVLGGDVAFDDNGFITDKFCKLLFEERLAPLDVKTEKIVVDIPTMMEIPTFVQG